LVPRCRLDFRYEIYPEDQIRVSLPNIKFLPPDEEIVQCEAVKKLIEDKLSLVLVRIELLGGTLLLGEDEKEALCSD